MMMTDDDDDAVVSPRFQIKDRDKDKNERTGQNWEKKKRKGGERDR